MLSYGAYSSIVFHQKTGLEAVLNRSSPEAVDEYINLLDEYIHLVDECNYNSVFGLRNHPMPTAP